jgi:hypothetical protein
MTKHAALEAFAPVLDMEIDPGVRRWVLILRQAGVETFESCQGGPDHAMPEPTIKFFGSPWAGYHAFAVAMDNGMPVLSLRYAYGVNNGQLEGPWWEMTFRTTDPDA